MRSVSAPKRSIVSRWRVEPSDLTCEKVLSLAQYSEPTARANEAGADTLLSGEVRESSEAISVARSVPKGAVYAGQTTDGAGRR